MLQLFGQERCRVLRSPIVFRIMAPPRVAIKKCSSNFTKRNLASLFEAAATPESKAVENKKKSGGASIPSKAGGEPKVTSEWVDKVFNDMEEQGAAKGAKGEAQFLADKICDHIDELILADDDAQDEPSTTTAAQAGQDEGGDDAPTEKEKAFEAAASLPSFDLRGQVGYWWANALRTDKGLAASYAALGKRYEAQRAFRREWAQSRLQEMKQERKATKKTFEEDFADATYEPPEVILEREGGGRNGLKATMNIIKAAIADTKAGRTFRGRKYIEKNARSQRYEILYIKHKVTSGMKRTWEESAYYSVASGPQSSTTSSTMASSSSEVPGAVAETPVKRLALENKAGNAKVGETSEAKDAKKAAKKDARSVLLTTNVSREIPKQGDIYGVGGWAGGIPNRADSHLAQS